MSGVACLGPNSGSRWHRLEPHVHAPGTVLNDQFRGADTWERYIAALNDAIARLRDTGANVDKALTGAKGGNGQVVRYPDNVDPEEVPIRPVLRPMLIQS